MLGSSCAVPLCPSCRCVRMSGSEPVRFGPSLRKGCVDECQACSSDEDDSVGTHIHPHTKNSLVHSHLESNGAQTNSIIHYGTSYSHTHTHAHVYTSIYIYICIKQILVEQEDFFAKPAPAWYDCMARLVRTVSADPCLKRVKGQVHNGVQQLQSSGISFEAKRDPGERGSTVCCCLCAGLLTLRCRQLGQIWSERSPRWLTLTMVRRRKLRLEASERFSVLRSVLARRESLCRPLRRRLRIVRASVSFLALQAD